MLKPLLGEQCHSYAHAYFFNFLAFPPQLLPQKSIFSRVLRPRVLLRVWIIKQAAVRFRQVAARAEDARRARIMQTTLNRRCQSQRRLFEFQSKWKSINLMQKQATRREFTMRRNIFWLCFISIGTWSFHEFLIRKFASQTLLERINIGLHKLGFLLLLSRENWVPNLFSFRRRGILTEKCFKI